MNAILEYSLFPIGSIEITIGKIITVALLLTMVAFFYRQILKKWLPLYFRKEGIQETEQQKTHRLVQFCLLFLSLILTVLATGLDYQMYVPATTQETKVGGIWISTLLILALLFVVARLLDWIIFRTLSRNFQIRREASRQMALNFDPPRLVRPARRLIGSIVLMLAILYIAFALDLDGYLPDSFRLGSGENSDTINIRPTKVISAILVLVVARSFTWLFIELVLFPYYLRKEINIGSQYAINQLFKYFAYVFAVLIALQVMNINLTILLGGAAALLVGIGLGLQQTFNDLISGIILLSERSIEIGDILEMGGIVGTVRRIGIRTSLVETRDNTTIIVPNSKLIGDVVTNWSHDEDKVRFTISVGVAYGSDTALVKKLLLQVAQEHPKAIKRPVPFVRFTNFGDSSLDFELHFWSKEFVRIEDVKSDMRFETDRLFREHNISIPFPQRDVWMRRMG